MIYNLIDSRIYIGSTVNFNKRKSEHIKKLRVGTHTNIHLLRFFNKYGIENLLFKIIDKTGEDGLLPLEQKYIDELRPKFNIAKYAQAPMKGRKHSEETKKKISLPGSRNGMFGRHRTDQEKESIRVGQIGRVKTNAEKLKRIKNLPNRIPVVAVSDSILIEEDSIADLSKVINVNQASVASALKNKSKCRGFSIVRQ